MNVLLGPHAFSASPAAALQAHVLDAAELDRWAAAWDRLSAEAVYPNPFHSRPVLAAHQACELLDERLRFIAVAERDELHTLLPFLPNGGRIGLKRAHTAWLPPRFAVNGTPLVGAAAPAETADRLIYGMASAGGLWRIPLLSVESPVGRALVAASRRRGFAIEFLRAFDRAVLHRHGAYDGYARDHLSPRRRKGLRRRLRKLEAEGRVAFASATAGEGLRRAVEIFLELERAGWKGRRRTALAALEPGPSLARALFGQPNGIISSRADVLTVDDRPIAVSLALLCGGTAFLLKTAYDERFRRFAPGLLLEDAILRSFFDEGFAEKLDSASLPGCVLEDFFVDRERIADLTIAADPAISPQALTALVRQERAKQAAFATMKRLYWRLVDWRPARNGE